MEVQFTNKILAMFALALTLTALVAGFSACGESDTEVVSQTGSLNGEIPVGIVYPVAGRLASIGTEMGRGFELAHEEITKLQLGDTKLRFITEDSRGDPEGAVEAFNKLIQQDGVSVILGPGTSSAAEAAFPIAQQNRVVAISATAAARGLSEIGDFAFRTILTTDVLITSGIAETQANLGYRKAAIMYDETDLFSADGAAVMRDALTANGVEILATETFQSGDTVFSAQLTRIKDLNPHVIFVSALPPDKPEILIQADKIGIPDSVTFIINTLTTADVIAAGDSADGAIAFTSWVNTADTPGNSSLRSEIQCETRRPHPVFGRHSRTPPHTSWRTQSRMSNPPIQPRFATH